MRFYFRLSEPWRVKGARPSVVCGPRCLLRETDTGFDGRLAYDSARGRKIMMSAASGRQTTNCSWRRFAAYTSRRYHDSMARMPMPARSRLSPTPYAETRHTFLQHDGGVAHSLATVWSLVSSQKSRPSTAITSASKLFIGRVVGRVVQRCVSHGSALKRCSLRRTGRLGMRASVCTRKTLHRFSRL